MSCLPVSSRTIDDLPYDRLKDFCENYENLSSSTLEVQTMVSELFGVDLKKRSISSELMLKPTDEIIYTIAFEILGNESQADLNCILSMAGQAVSATLSTDERIAITKEISPYSLLAAMENYASQKKKLQMWMGWNENRQKAVEKVFDFLASPSSDSTFLDLSNLNLVMLPPLFLEKFREPGHLFFNGNKFKEFPDLKIFRKATSIILSYNEISAIPFGIEAPQLVTHLALCFNQISRFPKDLKSFNALTVLHLSRNKIKRISQRVWFPPSLKLLYLDGNEISEIPENLEGFESLLLISLSENQITRFPEDLKGLPRLQSLDLSENEISEMPRKIEGLDGVGSSLKLSKNRIKEVPLTARERDLLKDGLLEDGFLDKIPDHKLLRVYLYPQRV